MIVEHVFLVVLCGFLVGCGLTTIIFVLIGNKQSSGVLLVTQEDEYSDPALLLDISREDMYKIAKSGTVRFKVKHRKISPRTNNNYYYGKY